MARSWPICTGTQQFSSSSTTAKTRAEGRARRALPTRRLPARSSTPRRPARPSTSSASSDSTASAVPPTASPTTTSPLPIRFPANHIVEGGSTSGATTTGMPCRSSTSRPRSRPPPSPGRQIAVVEHATTGSRACRPGTTTPSSGAARSRPVSQTYLHVKGGRLSLLYRLRGAAFPNGPEARTEPASCPSSLSLDLDATEVGAYRHTGNR